MVCQVSSKQTNIDLHRRRVNVKHSLQVTKISQNDNKPPSSGCACAVLIETSSSPSTVKQTYLSEFRISLQTHQFGSCLWCLRQERALVIKLLMVPCQQGHTAPVQWLWISSSATCYYIFKKGNTIKPHSKSVQDEVSLRQSDEGQKFGGMQRITGGNIG